jgi:putative transposase
VHPKILPGLAARVIQHARMEFGYPFHMIQSDNGPEFGRYFEQAMKSNGIAVRHTRLGRPNDNAHIERFNRTVQEECLGNTITRSTPITHMRGKLDTYLHYYNYKRVHLGLQCKTPVKAAMEVLQRS